MLDEMVLKLARIMKHIMPSNNDMQIDSNIDTATSNWLSQAYNTNNNNNNNNSTSLDSPRTKRRSLLNIQDVITESVDQSSSSNSVVSSIISKDLLDSWDLDVLEYEDKDLSEIMIYMFNSLGLLVHFQVPMIIFRQFLNEISIKYIKNTYHNYNHGCDVCHTVYRLTTLSHLNEIFNELEVFSLLIGALAHDVGHPGLNNLYLVKAKHPLALSHNDKSPLENMHCVVLYEVVYLHYLYYLLH